MRRVNPDFSQVESDAFQVEVNQRFPIFFSEKRPFFMEGAGIFTLAGAGQRQQPAARRAHAADRRSDLRREADGQRRAAGVRHADGARSGGRPQSAARRSRLGKDRLFNVAPRPVQPRAEQLRRRPGRRHGVRRRLQPRRRRRPVVARERRRSASAASCSRRATRAAARPTTRRPASARRPATSTARAGWTLVGYARALRPRLRDGDGVHQPRRHHQRLGHTPSTTSIPTRQVSVAAPDLAVLVHAGRPRSQRRRQRAAAGHRREVQLHASGFHAARSLRRIRDLGRPALRSRQLARAGRTSSCIAGCLSTAQHMFGHGGLLRSGRAVSGTTCRTPASGSRCSRAAACRRR